MQERLLGEISDSKLSPEIIKSFTERIREGNISQSENERNHLCVYFAAYDPWRSEVFMGHHKKSDLFLFTGGHIDQGENPWATLEREIWEEWGMRMDGLTEQKIELLTVTTIDNPKVACRVHYDIWYFFPRDKDKFNPDISKLSEEFYGIGWFPLDEAFQKAVDPATIEALTYLSGKIERGFIGIP